jgi:hypothetical protein
MDSIGYLAGDNLGSVIKLLLALRSEVLNIPAPSANGIIETSITLLPTKTFGNIEFTSQTLPFSEKASITKNGKKFTQTISFDIAKCDPSVSQFIDKYLGAEIIAVIKDGNYQANVIGNGTVGARLVQATGKREAKIEGGNQTTFELMCESTRSANFYLMVENIEGNRRRQFSSSFSNDFT